MSDYSSAIEYTICINIILSFKKFIFLLIKFFVKQQLNA